MPVELASAFRAALARAPFQAAADLVIEVDLEVALGAEIVMEQETFVPLVIENVLNSKFNPMPFAPEAEDIPVHIFRLRRAFTFNEE